MVHERDRLAAEAVADLRDRQSVGGVQGQVQRVGHVAEPPQHVTVSAFVAATDSDAAHVEGQVRGPCVASQVANAA